MAKELHPGQLLELDYCVRGVRFPPREWYVSKLPVEYSKFDRDEFFRHIHSGDHLGGPMPFHLVFLRELVSPEPSSGRFGRFQEFLDPGSGKKLVSYKGVWWNDYVVVTFDEEASDL